ncbi:hypothetical protein THASP1DRAFT_29530 [Thamnocephalis sphaerospora]|uniref:Extracellular membrane protein CFEM domain-containing protein n=1 Tax=Thamnocephalis sphaerospora TaxID=78915 RepID=A0A4P9XRG0_9FUNG|nr:hypothetical protein THASP1DRAFT_29530 [Thamnocephalis sphaerospora]|eukprot:RKP08674.1 hypothetical protein THASP1DRAFT_29530 [Thamnocephalis sphaerospora]
MKFTAAFVLSALVASAAAQVDDAPATPTTPAAPPNNCVNYNVYARCREDNQNFINACNPTDHACLCSTNKDLAQCYDQCKDDKIIFGQKEAVLAAAQAHCAAAPKTTSTPTSSKTSSSTSTSTNTPTSNSGVNGRQTSGLMAGVVAAVGGAFAYFA